MSIAQFPMLNSARALALTMAASFLILLNGCGASNPESDPEADAQSLDANDYFPLKENWRWQYKAIAYYPLTRDMPVEGELILEMTTQTGEDGSKCYSLERSRRLGTNRNEGSYQMCKGGEYVMLESPEDEFESQTFFPSSPEVGQEWQTWSYELKKFVQATWKIQAQEDVEAGGKTYADCWRVSGDIEGIQVTQHYAAGVGLVKEVMVLSVGDRKAMTFEFELIRHGPKDELEANPLPPPPLTESEMTAKEMAAEMTSLEIPSPMHPVGGALQMCFWRDLESSSYLVFCGNEDDRSLASNEDVVVKSFLRGQSARWMAVEKVEYGEPLIINMEIRGEPAVFYFTTGTGESGIEYEQLKGEFVGKEGPMHIYMQLDQTRFPPGTSQKMLKSLGK